MINKATVLIFGLFASMAVWASDNVIEALDDYAWNKRHVLLFAPSDAHTEYKRYLEATRNFAHDFVERKLQTWFIVGNEPVRLDQIRREELQASRFRTTFKIGPEDFRVILIGYDQGEKLRLQQADIDKLFGEIDMMPMRQQEMLD